MHGSTRRPASARWRPRGVPRTSPTRTSPITSNREEHWKYMISESVKVPLAYIFERRSQ